MVPKVFEPLKFDWLLNDVVTLLCKGHLTFDNGNMCFLTTYVMWQPCHGYWQWAMKRIKIIRWIVLICKLQGVTQLWHTVRHRDVGDKYATGVPKIKKIRGRENIAVGTWNVRTLRPAGKLEQLTHAMSRYHWNIVGLCEMRWKNFGEMSTDDGHKVYFSGEEGKHEYGVGFLVHKDVVDAVLGCQPVSSRLI